MEKPDGKQFREIMNLKRNLMFSEYAIVADYMDAMARYWHYSKRLFGKSVSFRKEEEAKFWAKRYREHANNEITEFMKQVNNGKI